MSTESSVFSKKLEEFVGGVPVRKLGDLCAAEFEGSSIVVVWFQSVVEGVDMWFPEDESKEMPKFRMKMKVKHGDDVAVFANFDKDVQKLAVETCPLMITMGESCSLFSDEMQCFYGDPCLCKVQKRGEIDFDNLPLFNVSSICKEVGVVDMFFNQYLTEITNNVESCVDDSIKKVGEGQFISHSSCGSKNDIPYDDMVNVSDLNVDNEVNSSVKIVGKQVNFSPKMYRRRFKSERLSGENGRSTYVEGFVSAVKRNVVKRKLGFEDGDFDSVEKNKKAGSFKCDDE